MATGERRLGELREKVLGEQRLGLLILRLALPLVFSASINVVYEVADTFWLSRLGEAALGTPTVSWPYMGVLFSISFGLASSISALVGQYAGAGRFDRAAKSLGTVLGLLLALTVPGSLVLILLIPGYLSLIGVPGDVRPLAAAYLTALLASLPFSVLFLAYTFALNALGDTRTPTLVSAFSSLLNFALDPVLIFGLGLGVLGASLATALSNIASALYAAYSLATGRHGLRLRPGDLAPDPGLLRLSLKVSAPVVGQRLGMNLGFITMMSIVSGLGTPVLAAYSIGQVVLSLDRMIAMPLARATGIIVAQSLGAGLAERAVAAARKGLLMLVAAVTLYIALLLLLSKPFIAVFNPGPEAAAAAERMIKIFGPSVLGFNLLILANIVARSSGHTLFMSILGVARLWLLRIPLSYTLAYRLALGDTGLWTGMALSNYITGAASAAWLLQAGWAQPVIEETPARKKPGTQ